MTRTLVMQMLEAMEEAQKYAHNVGKYLHGVPQAIQAAREYLETEPSGERADFIKKLRGIENRHLKIERKVPLDMLEFYLSATLALHDAANMLEADAHQNKPLTDGQLNALWHKVIDSGDPTAGNAHIRFYRAATKMENSK